MRQTILMGSGNVSALLARVLCEETDRQVGQTALGNNQATAFPLVATLTQFTTTAAGTGCKPSISSDIGDEYEVINFGANNLAVYPPLGGTLNNGGANASVNLAANTWGKLKQIAKGVWILR